MATRNKNKIASFYLFTRMRGLEAIKAKLLGLMEEFDVTGTIIIADEGFNGTVAAHAARLDTFLLEMCGVFESEPEFKFSYDDEPGFARRKVKIKKEIVTLKKAVSIDLGEGTHVAPDEWNQLITDPETILIDARNDYEFKVGTFEGAVNPGTESFSELPDFIESNFDPNRDPKIAMFCTGGIRCEKLAPFLKEKGFQNVYQLKGGILRYLEEVDPRESLWKGECFVFDERITVDPSLRRGTARDLSAAKKSSQKKHG